MFFVVSLSPQKYEVLLLKISKVFVLNVMRENSERI